MAGDADRIATEAGVWLARLERGLWPREGAPLREWLRRPAHREAIVAAAKLWHGPDIIAVLAQLVPVGFGTRPPPKPRSRRRLVSVLIGLCGVLVVFGPFAYVQHTAPPASQRRTVWGESVYTAGPGQTRVVDLTDGSSITLNAHSQVDVLFSVASRLARLEYGEAMFHTAPERRPFELSAGGRFLRAAAASFDVRVIRDQVLELTVLKGAVTVRALSWRWPSTPAQARQFDPQVFADTLVGPMHAASLEEATLHRYAITPAMADARLRWRPAAVIYIAP